VPFHRRRLSGSASAEVLPHEYPQVIDIRNCLYPPLYHNHEVVSRTNMIKVTRFPLALHNSHLAAMQQIWSMKKNEEAAAKRKPKTSAAQIRVQKGLYIGIIMIYMSVYTQFLDLTELDLPSTMKLNHPDATNLLNFELTITPDEGLQRVFYVQSCG
jgi:hypothetical protein